MARASDTEVVNQNLEVVQAFREFCLTPKPTTPEEIDQLGEDPWEEIDFYGLSLGFFIAKGVSRVVAFDLARIVRYGYGYWS